MKKTVLFLVCSVFVFGTANAEELVIQLKSGNSITIQYSGAIQGVIWSGTTDGIAGLVMPPPANTAVGQTKTAQQPASPASAVKAEEKKTDGSGIRFRWAEPQRED